MINFSHIYKKQAKKQVVLTLYLGEPKHINFISCALTISITYLHNYKCTITITSISFPSIRTQPSSVAAVITTDHFTGRIPPGGSMLIVCYKYTKFFTLITYTSTSFYAVFTAKIKTKFIFHNQFLRK